ncbi:MAG: hypothetical protein A3G41_07210 [Elusimicrobia bacterium RIFCSPLOWO2_12_FULL_59_9]|nr:MAG: hypothetical protein A3G41_07210 [Elusimicrobia bacterium RIFCSPLOWO2_12_FULL_59_9]
MTRWIYAGCCLLSASLAFGATADPSSASAQAREPLLLALAGDSDCAYRLARRSGEAELPSVDWDGTADEDKPAARSGLAPDHDCTSRRATGASGSPELRAGGRRAGPSDKPQSTPASQPEKIWAEPLGYHKLSTRLSAPEVRTPSIEVDFAINNVKDRVGADAAVCDPHSPTICDRSRFYFPQLRVDPEKKQILYNDEVVAAYEVKWLTVRITPSGRYILKAEIQQGIEDNGFDKYPVSYIAVYLEKIENPFYPRP